MAKKRGVSRGSFGSLISKLATTAARQGRRKKKELERKGIKFSSPPPKRTANPGVTSKEGSTTTSRTKFDPKTGRRTTGTNTSGTSTGPNIVDPGSRKGLGTAIKKAKKKKKQRR